MSSGVQKRLERTRYGAVIAGAAYCADSSIHGTALRAAEVAFSRENIPVGYLVSIEH